MVTTPLAGILDWTMGTSAGFAAYRDRRLNDMLRKILNTWSEFLCSPGSLYVLNDSDAGWTSEEAQRVVGNLARAYLADPRLLPDAWRRREGDEVSTARNVADYVAGMTDPFAISRHEALVGPVELPEKF